MQRIILTGLFLVMTAAIADDGVLPPPALDEKLQPATPPTVDESINREPVEPEVNIIKRKDKTVSEYRLNGRLYMVKITPKVGKPYYLIDRDGDGDLETRRSDLDPVLHAPQWVIFSW